MKLKQIDQMEMVLDKRTFKIMRYIYRKHEASYHEASYKELSDKFNDDDLSILSVLCDSLYAMYRPPKGAPTKDTSTLHLDGIFALTPPGNRLVEDRIRTNIQLIAPIIVSIVSLLVSITSLVIAVIFQNNEFIVHLR